MVLLGCWGWASLALGQSKTTEGTDFWFGFMENYERVNPPARPVSLKVFISSRNGATGRLEMPELAGFAPIPFSVDAGGSVTLTVRDGRPAIGDPEPMTKFGGKKRTGIHLTADDTISVYAINLAERTADATAVLPTPSLGTEYYVLAHKEDVGQSRESELLIVATEDSTVIEVTTSVFSSEIWPPGQPFEVFLDKGETYQIQSDSDLSGTHLVASGDACKPFAVFAGNKFTRVSACAAQDHLFEQMYPVSTWGKEFITVPLATRAEDYYKIVAAEDDTRIWFDNDPALTFPDLLDRGEVEDFVVDRSRRRKINADKPISILQLSEGPGLGNDPGCDNAKGDPFTIVLSPLEQRLEEVTFNAFEGSLAADFTYYMNLLIPSSDTSLIRLDGQALPIGTFASVEHEPAFAYAQLLDLPEGTHRLASPNGFLATIYGYGTFESYGYAAGASLIPINLQLELENALTGEAMTVEDICYGTTVTLSISSANPDITEFSWDFGDGSQTLSGAQVTHTFDQPGQYLLRVVGREPGDANCAQEEAFEALLDLQPLALFPQDSLIGPTVICPGATGVRYQFSRNAYEQYTWWAENGQVVSQSDSSAIVDWEDVAGVGRLLAVGRTAFGCLTDTASMEVSIGPNQTLDLPISGDTLVCPGAWDQQLYRLNGLPTNHLTEWQWIVVNGTVTDQPSPQQAVVSWVDAPQNYLTAIQREAGAIGCAFPATDTLWVDVRPNLADSLRLLQASWPPAGSPNDYIELQYQILDTGIAQQTTVFREQLLPQPLPEANAGLSAAPTHRDNNVNHPAQYAYRLQGQHNCDQSTFFSEQVRTIFLSAAYEAGSIRLDWSPVSLPSSLHFWRQDDQAPYQQLDPGGGVLTEESLTLEEAAPSAASACFKLSATPLQGGDPIWSNEACIRFGTTPGLPPLLTPNGDGANDRLQIRNVGLLESYQLLIFNRWGQQVFAADQSNFQVWAGHNQQGQPLPAGTYFYLIKGRDRNGQTVSYAGAVTLVR